MNAKRIIVSIIILSILGAGLISIWIVYRWIVKPLRAGQEIPVELREARIVVGSELLSRTQFIKTNTLDSLKDVRDPVKLKSSMDSIEDIAVGELDGTPGLDIGIAGHYGAVLLDRRGNIKERLLFDFGHKTVQLGPFKPETEKMIEGDIQIVDLEGDGVCEYLGKGSLDGAAVLNHRGEVLWNYGEYTEAKGSINSMTVGDVAGDRQAEFVVSWKGIQLFDRHGTKLWEQAEDYSGQVEVVDVDGNGANEIVYQRGNNLVVRDAQGQIVKTTEMPFYLGSFSLCRRLGDKAPPQLLVYHDENLCLIDLDGHVAAQLAAPLSRLKRATPDKIEVPGMEPIIVDEDEIYKAEGLWIELVKGQPAYLAIITQFAVMDRSLFYVYDAQGKLVYQEVMPEHCSSIAVLPSEDASQPPGLLVGGEETVWQYTAR